MLVRFYCFSFVQTCSWLPKPLLRDKLADENKNQHTSTNTETKEGYDDKEFHNRLEADSFFLILSTTNNNNGSKTPMVNEKGVQVVATKF